MNKPKYEDIKRTLYILIIISTITRLFIAATLEFSVDEVYYWTYALYPDWSHFDHPPMVGLVIQLFSLNLLLDSELAIRLGPVIFSIFNTFLIYSIGKSIKNPLTGLYAAFLLNSSIYCSLLAGNFIIPDTPQLLFWLLSLRYLIQVLPQKTIDKKTSGKFILACLFIGLVILSKYHGVFIWGGIVLYVIFYNRLWLREPSFYLGMLLSILFIIPIVWWNIENNWISFTFHGDRVANALQLRLDYLFRELFGQVAYNNPINYVIILLALIASFKKRLSLKKEYQRVLILNSLPIWLVFTSFALFRQTLPHWTGPAFTPLLILAASYLSDKTHKLNLSNAAILFPKVLRSSIYLLCILLALAWLLINYYPGSFGKKDKLSEYGNGDFTLDMYGWKQIKLGFEKVVKRDSVQNSMPFDAPIINPKYFPGTEIDYYVARPLNKKVILPGSLNNIHKYAWINVYRGGLTKGSDVYMISTSNWYKDPFHYYSDNFDEIIPTDTIKINRSGKLAYYAFVYQLKGYKDNIPNPIK